MSSDVCGGRRFRLGFGEGLCALVAFVCFAYVTTNAIGSRMAQARQSARFHALVEAALRPGARSVGAPPAVPHRAPAAGDPLGRLRIPALDLYAMIAPGADSRVLRNGIGWLRGSALPGDPGNVALAAHRDTFFHGLGRLRPGDAVHLETPWGAYSYRVESMRIVAPTDTSVLAPSPEPTLTLITCYPFTYLGPAPLRFVVRARQMP